MARSAQLAMRGFGGRVRFWGDVLSGVKYRVFEALGALLVLASLLLVLALLTYFPGDASFDTAVAAPPRNYLGYDGAVIADLFMQSVGFAAYPQRMDFTGRFSLRDAWTNFQHVGPEYQVVTWIKMVSIIFHE